MSRWPGQPWRRYVGESIGDFCERASLELFGLALALYLIASIMI